MTWSDFNRYCRHRMGDYLTVVLFEHHPIGSAYHSVALITREHMIEVFYQGEPKDTRQAALADGMTIIRRRLRAERTRAERN